MGPKAYTCIPGMDAREIDESARLTDITASGGLAALGNTKNAPELLREARVKQVKVLRQL